MRRNAKQQERRHFLTSSFRIARFEMYACVYYRLYTIQMKYMYTLLVALAINI